jgi:pimeloyl-ACP methyl ester carboxylesterase
MPLKDLERDGRRLSVEDRGSGETALVFLHPWTGDHTFLEPQIDHFSNVLRCVGPDLAGHGRSSVPGEPVTIASLAADVGWVCDELALTDVVLVGNSMGGNVAIQLAASRPELVGAVVLLDAVPLNPEPFFSDLLAQFVVQLRGPESISAQREYCEGFLFLPDDRSERKDAIVRRMCETDRGIAADAFAASTAWDGEAAASSVTVPVLVLAASDLGSPDRGRLASVLPTAEVVDVPGAGHFLQLEQPELVNERIQGFLNRLGLLPAMGG